MTELSPASKSVHDAFWQGHEYPDSLSNVDLAAALRAAADQIIPMTKTPWGSTLVPVLSSQESREKLLAIADELDSLEA